MCNKQKKTVLVPCPTCNSMSHKLSMKLTKSDKESRQDVDNQTETGPCLSSSSIPPKGVGTHRVILSTFAMVSNFDLAKAHACLDRQGGGRPSLEEDILADREAWHTGQSSKSISPLWHPPTSPWMDDGIDRHPSTMEQRLRVGIRDLCSLSSWKACLEGNEKEKLTREVPLCWW